MQHGRWLTLRRTIAVAATIGALAGAAGTPAIAKASKAKKTTAKKAPAKKTTAKKATAKPATTQTTAAPASKGTIKIGVFGTSASASTGAKTLEESRKLAEAWEKVQDRAGGINGYKIQVVYKATNGDPARALQAVREFDRDGVITLAGQDDSNGVLAIQDYLRDKNLPLVGGAALDTTWDTHPMLFNVGSSYYGAVFASVFGTQSLGAKSYRRLYCTESAACINSVPLSNKAAQALGMKGSAEGASASAADYTPACLNAKKDGIDAIHNAGLNMPNLVRDCSRQGYHPIYAQTVTSLFQATVDAVKGERFVGASAEFPAWYNGPETAAFHAAVRLTDLKEGDYGRNATEAWLSLETVKAALMKMTAPNPTRPQFLQSLCSLKGETLGGQIYPMDYSQQCTGQRHSNNDCWYNWFIDDNALKLMNKSGGVAKTLAEAAQCGTGAPDQPNK